MTETDPKFSVSAKSSACGKVPSPITCTTSEPIALPVAVRSKVNVLTETGEKIKSNSASPSPGMVTLSTPKLKGAPTSLNDTVCSTIRSFESDRVRVRVLSMVVGGNPTVSTENAI